ncbi:hypothetical protein CTI12_AA500670 [Artemisia annua]|uniref:Uncharacterized protein n=1 Tax=Artemisia annua TaxID=35608 RepID=A0A2U1LCY3_ARTAN|nr:hypothetical protein CTI12_AA500670 [Artemisia annua]
MGKALFVCMLMLVVFASVLAIANVRNKALLMANVMVYDVVVLATSRARDAINVL